MIHQLTETQIQHNPSTVLSTRLAEICLETIDAKGDLKRLGALRLESNGIVTELQRRKRQVLASCTFTSFGMNEKEGGL